MDEGWKERINWIYWGIRTNLTQKIKLKKEKYNVCMYIIENVLHVC